ncbi:MAG: hypothetical protein R3182_04820, partial [Draconibacterium sp.]|nr:hypothetical protein [Draconibacterium sp.]
IEENKDWTELKQILDNCAGEYTNDNRPKNTLTTYLTDAPILGNGEIGLVLGGDDDKQTIYLNRNDNWTRALGGVTISTESEGTEGANLNYKQNITASTIEGKLNIKGNATELECRVVVDQPLALITVKNSSEKTVRYEINTWSKPYLDDKGRPLEGKPFYLMPWNWYDTHTLSDNNKTVETIPFSYKEGIWPAKDTAQNPFWKLIQAFDDQWFVQNVNTNKFLVVNEDGSLDALEQLRGDNSGKWEIIPVYQGFFFKNVKLGKTMAHENNKVVVKEFESDKTEHRSWMRKELRWQFEYPEGYFDKATNSIDGEIASTYREVIEDIFISKATISTRVIGGKVEVEDGIQKVDVPAGESITIAIAVDGDGNRKNKIHDIEYYLASGKNRLLKLNEKAIENLDREREEWWKNYWLKCWVNLGNKKLNQYWYGAYHALGCASRAGGDEMPSLWGAWITVDNPNWGNDHYNNYNHISPYFGIFSGNRCDLIEPYAENQMKYLPYFKNRTARAGYKGVVFPRVTKYPETTEEVKNEVPIAKSKNRELLLNDQLDASVYIGLNIFFYYEYTLDETFLKETAYPFAIECINFFEDYLEFEDGRYVLYKSGAREGTGNDTNPAYPLGYIKKLCQFLLSTSETLGVDEERREKWNHIFEYISNYPTTEVNGKTVFKEAENRDEIGLVNNGVHDNASRLQFIFPGEQVGLESDPQLLEIAYNSWEHLNSKPAEPAWLQGNNFPIVLPQVVRIGVDPDYLYPEIIKSLETCFRNNLTVFIFGGGIENCGATEAINSMMMQSHESSIKLFPVWPQDVDAKFNQIRAKGAFLVSSELKNGEIKYVEILSKKGGVIRITNPWQGSEISMTVNDKNIEIDSAEILEIRTSLNDKILLELK